MTDVGEALLAPTDLPGLAWLGPTPFDRDTFTAEWLALRGRTLEEERGDQWLAGIHPRDRAVCREAFGQAARSAQAYEIEYRLVASDGEYRRLRECARPVRRQGSVIFVGTCVDLTAQTAQEAEPRARRDNGREEPAKRSSSRSTNGKTARAASEPAPAAVLDARVVLDALPGLVLVLGADQRVRYANRMAARLAEAASDALVGERLEATMLPRWLVEPLAAAAKRAVETGAPQRFEARSDADPQVRSFAGEVVRDAADAKGALVIAHENAPRVASNEASEIEADGRAKDEFLALVSHELRSPLNSITGWTHVLEQALKSREESTLQRAVEGIKRSSAQQAKLIADLMDAAYLISGKLRLYASATSLPNALAAAVEGNRAAAEAKRVVIEVTVDGDPPPVWGDPDRLQQMAWHLLSIGVKFSPSGGRVEARIHCPDASQVVLEIRDHGRGFSQEGLERALAGMPGSGAGIGLSLVRRLAELHGGSLIARSEGEGKGACFCLHVPVHRDTLDGTESGARAVRALEGLAIMLLGEPDAGASGPVSLTLMAAGAGVKEADNADQALATFAVADRDAWPDLLVCDTGPVPAARLDFIRKLRALESQRSIPPESRLRTLALTPSVRPEDHTQLVLAGFEEVLVKPFAPHDLTEAVTRMVGRSPAA